MLIAACMLILPWIHLEGSGEWLLLPEITDSLDGKGEGFGPSYIAFPCYLMAFFGILYAFAAGLDSVVMRWIHFGFAALVALFGVGGVMLVSMASTAISSGETGGASDRNAGTMVVFALAVLVLLGCLGLALVRGLAIRIIGGLLLTGYMLVHTVALLDLLDRHVELLPFAFAATVGYLLCAIGAFIGPRYVMR